MHNDHHTYAKECQTMSDPISDAKAKIKSAMALLLEAQRQLEEASQNSASPTVPSQSTVDSSSEAPQDANTQPSSKRDAIEALFAAALRTFESDDALTEALKTVMHSSIATNKHALASLVRFNWSRLSAQKHHYLNRPNDPSSFSINREQPVPNQPSTTIKIFLDAPNRNPTPCTLMQEADGSWKILTFSL